MNEKFARESKRLLDKLWYDEIDISAVSKLIDSDKYEILPESIAIGQVYKVSYEGNLLIDGYEKGFLFLPKDSGIKEHEHKDDIEQYTLISGELKLNGESMHVNRCMIGESHGIDPVSVNTAIKTLKISKKLIEENVNKKIY